MSEYKIGTCALHALNLTLSTPIKTILGRSGLKARTTLQVLFTAFNLTQQYRGSKWKLLWETCNNSAWHNMKKPILMRWDSVLESTNDVLKEIGQWKVICTKIITVETYGSNKHTIASYLYSYLHEQMLVSHLQFCIRKHVDPQTLQLAEKG